MKYVIAGILLFISSCTVSVHNNHSKEDTALIRTSEYQKEIDQLLAADAENKKWEEIYLKEIAIAQDNEDHDAYRFFIVEYIKLPRLIIPKWMEKEPGFVPRQKASSVLRITFRDRLETR